MITESEALQKIMNIIATPGEDMTDGECIEQDALSKQYQKKSDKEHVLDNPDTYIGSKEKIDEQIRLSKIQTELNWSQGDKQ